MSADDPGRNFRRMFLFWALVIAGLSLLTGCAKPPEPTVLARACPGPVVVVTDTIIVTGASGERVGLIRRREVCQ